MIPAVILFSAGVLAFILITIAASLRCPKCGGWHPDQECE